VCTDALATSSHLLCMSPFFLVPRVLQWGHDGSNPCGAKSQRSRLGNARAIVWHVPFGRSVRRWSGQVYVLPVVNAEAHCTTEAETGLPPMAHAMCRRIHGSAGPQPMREMWHRSSLRQLLSASSPGVLQKRHPCTWPHYGAQRRI
jgi:hypothetical protein